MPVDLGKIYDKICAAFKQARSIAWQSITQGDLEYIPIPEDFVNYTVGQYFAVVVMPTVTPEHISSPALFKPHYDFELYLCQKGREGDLTKKRSALVNYVSEWAQYWANQHGYLLTLGPVITKVKELEKDHDLIAVVATGNISELTTIYGRFDE